MPRWQPTIWAAGKVPGPSSDGDEHCAAKGGLMLAMAGGENDAMPTERWGLETGDWRAELEHVDTNNGQSFLGANNVSSLQSPVSSLLSAPCTLHPALCTLHSAPAPCTLHPAPCTLPYALCTLHPAPCTLHSAPCTLHSALCTLQSPITSHQSPVSNLQSPVYNLPTPHCPLNAQFDNKML